MEDTLVIELTLLLILLVLTRIFYLVHKITTGHTRKSSRIRTKLCKTVICIGSGGHTTEMLRLVDTLNFEKYSPRYYIMANTDRTSFTKVQTLENTKQPNEDEQHYTIIQIPRSRVVHQSYFSSVFTTLYSILYSIPIVCKIRPDLILCNGPGTCIPICTVAFLLKVAFICDTRIVFIESFCRTKTLSLSGKILKYFADNFIVQWPSLKNRLKRAEYIGQLM